MLEALDRSVVDTSRNVVTKKTHGKTVFGTSFGAAVGTRAFNSGRWAIKWRLQRVTEANGDGIIIGVVQPIDSVQRGYVCQYVLSLHP